MRGADIRRAVIRRQHQNRGGFAGMEGTARRQPGECRKGLFFCLSHPKREREIVRTGAVNSGSADSRRNAIAFSRPVCRLSAADRKIFKGRWAS